VISWV